MKKIEIVIEATALHRLTELVEECGASGYTIVPEVVGKGLHGLRDEAHVTDVFRNSLLIVVVPDEIASRIVDRARSLLDRYVGFLYLSDVEVPGADG